MWDDDEGCNDNKTGVQNKSWWKLFGFSKRTGCLRTTEKSRVHDKNGICKIIC